MEESAIGTGGNYGGRALGTAGKIWRKRDRHRW